MLGVENQPDIHFDDLAPTHREGALLMEKLGVARKCVDDWTDDEKNKVTERFRFCTNSLQERMTAAEADDTILFHKEHPQYIWRFDARVQRDHGVFDAVLPQSDDETYEEDPIVARNPTVLPIECLISSQVILCIRHPALIFPSLFRGVLELRLQDPKNWKREIGRSCMTLSYSRVLYDWYRSCSYQFGAHGSLSSPIILSMNDFVDDPSLVSKLAKSIGLDPAKTQTKWNTTSMSDSEHATRKIFLRTINQSTGVMKEKALAIIDLEVEKRKWVEEFGVDAAGIVADCVDRAMPDYEYLMARRLQ